MLVDSHCHINFISFKDDADAIIKDFLRDNYALVVVGSQESSSIRAIEYAEKYERGVYAAVGLHPIDLVEGAVDTVMMDGKPCTFTSRQEVFDQAKYRELAKRSNKVVAIGEVGLDYYYFDKYQPELLPEYKRRQAEALRGFIALAEELDKPLIFHCRGEKSDPYGAYGEMLEIIKSELAAGRKIRGVVHCFGGNAEQARGYVEAGLHIGFTGIITFKRKAEELQEIAKLIPLDRILIETDAPFLSPEPHRGERCLPQYVKYVANKIADLRGISVSEAAAITTANARSLFKI